MKIAPAFLAPTLPLKSKADATPRIAAQPLDLLEVSCLAAVIAIAITGWLSLTLASVDRYRPLVAMLVGLLTLFVTGAALVRQSSRSVGLADVVGLVVPLVLGCGLFFPADEWILGALDPGSYVNAGAAIAKSGALVQRSQLLTSLSPDLREALFPFPASRLPGFYLTVGRFSGPFLQSIVASTDQVVPHGFPLYPVVLSLGYAIGGIRAELLVTPLLALLGMVTFFLLARRLFGSFVASLASVFLVLGPAEIWFARFPDAEIIAQVLLLGGLLAFAAMAEKPSWELGIVAGVALGAVHLEKIEELPLPFILAGFLGYRLLQGQLDRRWLGFVATYLFLTIQAVVQAYYIATWYTVTTFDKSIPPRTAELIAVAIGAATVGTVALFVRSPLRTWVRGLINNPRCDRFVGIAAPAAIAVLALYAYYVRPLQVATIDAATANIGQLAATNDAQSFVRLGWYITPLGVLLGTLGWILIAREERRARTMLPLLVIAAETVLYLTHMYITPVHFWAARRWIPLVIPGFALAAAYFVNYLFNLRRRPFDAIVPASLALILVVGLIGSSRPLLGYVEYRGAINQLQALANQFPENAVVLFPDGDAGQRFSVPLEYIYDRTSIDVLSGTEQAAGKAAKTWQAQGRPVYWVTTAELPDPSAIGAQGTIVARQRISLPEKIVTRDTRPGADGLFQQDLIIWRLTPDPARSQTP